MGVHGEGVHAANIGVRYVAYFQAIFPMSVHHTHLKVKPPVQLCIPRRVAAAARRVRRTAAATVCTAYGHAPAYGRRVRVAAAGARSILKTLGTLVVEACEKSRAAWTAHT